MPAWSDVVELGLRLPEVEEATWFGTPSVKVRGKNFCRLRTEPDALVMRVLDVDDAEALVRGQPDVFFTTPHYDGWPYVLVRLDAVSLDQLAEPVEDGGRVRAPERVVAAYDG